MASAAGRSADRRFSHLSNNLIDRTLNELVTPLRKLSLREEEIVAVKAIIILNPSKQAARQSTAYFHHL